MEAPIAASTSSLSYLTNFAVPTGAFFANSKISEYRGSMPSRSSRLNCRAYLLYKQLMKRKYIHIYIYIYIYIFTWISQFNDAFRSANIPF